MSIILSLLLGGVFGLIMGVVWRAEEMKALQKANLRLIEERDNAQNVFRTRQRQSWVN